MRRLLLGAGVMVAFLVAPAWGATKDVTVENFDFSPGTVTITQGDRVTWHWSDANHSVTSDPGSAEKFDSDPGDPQPLHPPEPTTFSHDFMKAGTFTYHCKVHPSMQGKVVVKPPAGSGPPPDTTPPAVNSVKVRAGRSCHKRKHCKKRATKITFQLSEAARVRITFKRSKGKQPKPVVRQAPAGQTTVKRSVKQLPRGRYAMKLIATDASGNASKPVKRTVRVR
jgi:plastocyanin